MQNVIFDIAQPYFSFPSSQQTLIFKNSDDLITFCAVVDSYYHLKIDANSCVLHGDLESPSDPEYLGTGKAMLYACTHSNLESQTYTLNHRSIH